MENIVSTYDDDEVTFIVCDVCNIKIRSDAMYRIHLTTIQHLKKEEALIAAGKARRDQPLPVWTSYTHYLDYLQLDEPIIGLNHIMEVETPPGSLGPRYLCRLCRYDADMPDMTNHIIGRKHRQKYLEMQRPDLVSWDRSNVSQVPGKVVRAKAEVAERQEGRGLPERLKRRPAAIGKTGALIVPSPQWRGKSPAQGVARGELANKPIRPPLHQHGPREESYGRGRPESFASGEEWRAEQPRRSLEKEGGLYPHGHAHQLPVDSRPTYHHGDRMYPENADYEEERKGGDYEDKDRMGGAYEGEGRRGMAYEGQERWGVAYEGDEMRGEVYEGVGGRAGVYKVEKRRGEVYEGVGGRGGVYKGEERGEVYDGVGGRGGACKGEERRGGVYEGLGGKGGVYKEEERGGEVYEGVEGRGGTYEREERRGGVYEGVGRGGAYKREGRKTGAYKGEEGRGEIYSRAEPGRDVRLSGGRRNAGNSEQEVEGMEWLKGPPAREASTTVNELPETFRRFLSGAAEKRRVSRFSQDTEPRREAGQESKKPKLDLLDFGKVDVQGMGSESGDVLDDLRNIDIRSVEEANFIKEKLCNLLKEFQANKSQTALRKSPSVFYKDYNHLSSQQQGPSTDHSHVITAFQDPQDHYERGQRDPQDPYERGQRDPQDHFERGRRDSQDHFKRGGGDSQDRFERGQRDSQDHQGRGRRDSQDRFARGGRDPQDHYERGRRDPQDHQGRGRRDLQNRYEEYGSGRKDLCDPVRSRERSDPKVTIRDSYEAVFGKAAADTKRSPARRGIHNYPQSSSLPDVWSPKQRLDRMQPTMEFDSRLSYPPTPPQRGRGGPENSLEKVTSTLLQLVARNRPF